jgi:hypothetical protein
MEERAPQKSLSVMTIGHSTRSAKEFIQLLKAHHVKAASRCTHHPAFAAQSAVQPKPIIACLAFRRCTIFWAVASWASRPCRRAWAGSGAVQRPLLSQRSDPRFGAATQLSTGANNHYNVASYALQNRARRGALLAVLFVKIRAEILKPGTPIMTDNGLQAPSNNPQTWEG